MTPKRIQLSRRKGYRKPNGAGGHVYSSDEIGGGVVVWDTCLVASDTLLTAVVAENARAYREKVEERKVSDGR